MAEPTADRPFSRFALLAIGLALLAAAALLLAALGTRADWWGLGTGFTLLKWGAYGGILAAMIAIVAIIRARPGGPRRGLGTAGLALVIGLVAAGVPWSWEQRAQSVPPIHDITTDTENPPEFVAILPLRADAPNDAVYAGAEVAAQQHAAYPEIETAVLEVSADSAFERALDAARSMGWAIVAAAPHDGRIEATATTFWFGFKDDVVIRVRPSAGGGSRVDVRSVSRVGKGDVGTNAERVREYLAVLREVG